MSSRILGCIAVCAVFSPAVAQVAWNLIPAPPNQGSFVYDSYRERLVAVGNPVTYEYDGVNWTSVGGATTWLGIEALTYDAARRRVVLLGSQTSPWEVWEWDGFAWAFVSNRPSGSTVYRNLLVADGAGRTIALEDMGSNGIGVWVWDGATYMHSPQVNPPPTVSTFPNAHYWYHSAAYDEIAQQIVLFGRSRYGHQGAEAVTWTWDPVAGWVDHGSTGTFTGTATIWFDVNRGAIVRYDAGNSQHAAYVRDVAGGWLPLASPPLWMPGITTYDPHRNRLYTYNSRSGPGQGYGYLADVHPATYDAHRPGCTIPGAPTLQLSQSWTPAWRGTPLSVEIGNLQAGFGILAMGFHDQVYGSLLLPHPLSLQGMAGCFLNHSPDATVLAAAAAGTATVTIPIPDVAALVGLRYFQQAFGAAPGANPAGMLASDSRTGTVGQSR